MLDQKLAEAMQRILSKPNEKRFSANSARHRLVEDFSLGTKRGASVYFSERDRAEMRALLQARGYATTVVDMSGMSRSDRLNITPNEKAGGEAVKRNRISVKALAGQPLLIGDMALHLPPEAHLDADWTKILRNVKHGCIMVVENYENFNRLHETEFHLPPDLGSPLVVYHGDPNESRLDGVQRFVEASGLPVIAFMDVDPAGIAMASRFVSLVAMVAPPPRQIQAQFDNPKIRRSDLFLNQYPVVAATLEGIRPENPCRALWTLVSKHRAGVVQERWITGIPCEAWLKTSPECLMAP